MVGFINIVSGFSQTAIDELVVEADALYITEEDWAIDDTQTMSTLANAVSAVSEPTKFIMSNETYTSTIELGGNSHPVWVIAENPQGVIMRNRLNITGDEVILEGFYWTGGSMSEGVSGLEVNGNDCKITRCLWDDASASHWVRIQNYTERCEFSYNTLQNKNNNLTLSGHGQVFNLNKNFNEATASNHHIHHNYFYNIPPHNGGNGGESIQSWVDDTGNEGPFGVDTNTLIEYNLFLECDGDPEIISNKQNKVTFSNNTFQDSSGGFWFRFGNRNVLDNNYLLNCVGNGASVRVIDHDNIITNNYIDGNTSGAGVELGSGDGGQFIEADDANVSNNIIMNCDSGFRTGRTTTDTQPSNILVNANQFINCDPNGAFRIGTTLPNSTFTANEVEGTVGTDVGDLTLGNITLPPDVLDGVLTSTDVGINA